MGVHKKINVQKLRSEHLLKKNSTDHHYIPIFFSKGFVNSHGLLYVYDKNKNEIQTQQKSPKSVFFEADRNTVDVIGTQQSSALEDIYYKKIDDEASLIIRKLRNEVADNPHVEIGDIEHFLRFLIKLYWRIPATDITSSDVIDRTKIMSDSISPEKLRDDQTFRKLLRSQIAYHTLKQIELSPIDTISTPSLRQFPKDIFVLGDNPLVYRTAPKLFREFGETDLMIAISSSRIFSLTSVKMKVFERSKAMMYNAFIIHQSLRYVVCSDRNILTEAVTSYNECIRRGDLLQCPDMIFS
ncbi:MAG: DUF4238 domain-containing protein [Saprospiraceae bacterium]